MHTFGHPVKTDELLEVLNRYNIPLVEDAAESLGSYYTLNGIKSRIKQSPKSQDPNLKNQDLL
jgi:hypothetical protein